LFSSDIEKLINSCGFQKAVMPVQKSRVKQYMNYRPANGIAKVEILSQTTNLKSESNQNISII